MNGYPDLWRCLQHLCYSLQAQQAQIRQLDAKVQELLNEFKRMKEQPSPQPIHNEYKFDLLKVERLEGTLNIGINPKGTEGSSSIDEFTVDQTVDAPAPIEKQHPELHSEIMQQMDDYFNDGANETLGRLAEPYNLPLDEAYRRFIIDDVRKQIERRVREYMSRVHPEEVAGGSIDAVRQSIVDQVKRDIDSTFQAFIQNLGRKENGA